MTIWNWGSINADHVYRVPHLPGPGETLAAEGYARHLGGKGANMSIAAAKGAGASVEHLGAVGSDGAWAKAALAEAGVGTGGVLTLDVPSGNAVILVDRAGENEIVILGGANRALDDAMAARALEGVRPGDWFLTQNETSAALKAARLAKARGAKIAYAAAPFEADAAAAMLPLADLLALNAVEAAALAAHIGRPVEEAGPARVLVTRGAAGAVWHGPAGRIDVPAPAVAAVDTTGAGDTYLGVLLGHLDQGMEPGPALARAAAAAAIQVTRPGAAEAIPGAAEVAAALDPASGWHGAAHAHRRRSP